MNKEQKKLLKDLLKKGFIKPSVTPWDAPILLICKKGSSLRICIDYHNVTIRNMYFISNNDDFIYKLQDTSFFSMIYIRLGQNELRVREFDISKVAFRTVYGNLEFGVICFGQTNYPITFMDKMCFQVVLGYVSYSLYIWNLIYSQSESKHANHMKIVLETLKDCQQFDRFINCEFWFK